MDRGGETGTARKEAERERWGAVQYGLCKTAVFHLDSESVKEKFHLAFLTLDLPACPVSLLAGSGNFHGNTKKACTD